MICAVIGLILVLGGFFGSLYCATNELPFVAIYVVPIVASLVIGMFLVLWGITDAEI